MIRTTTAFFVLRDGCLLSFLCDVWKDEYGEWGLKAYHYVRFPIRTLAMKKTDHLINHVFGVRNTSRKAVLIQLFADYVGVHTIELEICHKVLLSHPTMNFVTAENVIMYSD